MILEALEREGVEVIFGYPGGANLPIYQHLHEHPKLKHILVRHEQGAAHMADGYARACGKPGRDRGDRGHIAGAAEILGKRARDRLLDREGRQKGVGAERARHGGPECRRRGTLSGIGARRNRAIPHRGAAGPGSRISQTSDVNCVSGRQGT